MRHGEGATGRGGAGGPSDAIDRYFELSAEIENAKSSRNYAAVGRAARQTYALLPRVVQQWKREYGSFDIGTSHAVHTAPTLMAVLGDADGIRELRSTLDGIVELRHWLPAADQADEDILVVRHIMAAIHQRPGIIQSSLKRVLASDEGARISQLASWLEKAGRIRRVKKGSSYQLYLAEYAIPSAALTASAEVERPVKKVSMRASAEALDGLSRNNGGEDLRLSRLRRSAAKAHILDFSGLPIVRLPMAPPAWEERQAQESREARDQHDATAASPATTPSGSGGPRFVMDGSGWTLDREEKLRSAERPDPSLRDAFHTGRYTYWIDPKGKREGFEYAESVIQVVDRMGREVAECGLPHDVYRAGVAPDGAGLLLLSRDGVLHGYNNNLEPFLNERLLELPEYKEQADRLGIEPRELKNHVRCIALAGDSSRYLVTVVDEAWCIDVKTGSVIWGSRMPTKEGWTRHVANRSERSGTSADVEAALGLMELELPISPDDVVRQYRKLALRWHPDRNPGDATATARFQDLRAAMELLTGADLLSLSLSANETGRVTYAQVLSTQRVAVGLRDLQGNDRTFTLTASLVVGEKHAADWIYAANLAKDGRTFLAGYSGKVVVVSEGGVPERVYDIGAVPRQIVDAGGRLYILTDTRLYVVSGDRLDALVDVYGASDVVVTDCGFALFERKALTWFSPAGKRIGTVRMKDPLRRAFSTSEGLVIETRQHRAHVTGPPPWWN